MLKQRIITALMLLPLVFLLLFKVPVVYFSASIALVTFLIALEWARLAGYRSALNRSLFALAVSLINLLIWHFSDSFKFWPSLSWPNQLVWDYPMIALAVSLLATLVAIGIVFSYSKIRHWWANIWIRSLLGLTMLPGFFVALICIRNVHSMEDFYYGGQLVLLMFFMIWAADTGAYFSGKAFGKRALAPVVSPNKTWEGVVGGMILSFAVAWTGVYLLKLNVQTPWLFSVLVLLLMMISVLGDLFESALKRVENIKDSSNLLPGHGGLFDRLDSSIVVAPLFYLLYSYYGWF